MSGDQAEPDPTRDRSGSADETDTVPETNPETNPTTDPETNPTTDPETDPTTDPTTDPADEARPTGSTPASSSSMADRRGDRPDLSARRRRRAEAEEAALSARGAAGDGSSTGSGAGAGDTGADGAGTDGAGTDGSSPRRRRWLVGVIAAVVVIALAVALIVYLLTRPASPTPTPGGTDSASPTAPPVLSAASMLDPTQAKAIAPDATFSLVSDSSGQATSTSPACLSPSAVQNAPNAQAVHSRTLTTGGDDATLVLHQAQAFGSTDEATLDFALLSKALGNCDLADSYLLRGSVITGLGDQSAGVVVRDQAKKQDRTVVVARTGVVVDVLDVVTASGRGDAPLDGTAKAMGSIVNGQCTNARGQCASLVKVADGPPPAAGDQPGYLTIADLPQPEAGESTWIGSNPGKPGALSTSGCENVDFSKVDADSAGSRTYLLDQKPSGTPDSFGIDEAVFTMADTTSATDLAKQLTDNLKSCKERQLTASVSAETTVDGVGADNAEISGTTFKVDQQINDDTTSHFRIGIATVGTTVVYLFLPTQDKFDLTDDQWGALLVRAGARASQVS